MTIDAYFKNRELPKGDHKLGDTVTVYPDTFVANGCPVLGVTPIYVLLNGFTAFEDRIPEGAWWTTTEQGFIYGTTWKSGEGRLG